MCFDVCFDVFARYDYYFQFYITISKKGLFKFANYSSALSTPPESSVVQAC